MSSVHGEGNKRGRLHTHYSHEGTPYLWAGVSRRVRDLKSTPGHEAVMNQVSHLLNATLVTGFGSKGCTPWADSAQKSSLDQLMRHQWVTVSHRIGRIQGQADSDVGLRPTPEEARKVS